VVVARQARLSSCTGGGSCNAKARQMRVCVCVGLCARRRGDGVADVQPFRYQDSRAADGVVMESQKKTGGGGRSRERI
jgi:hypothetical protein